MADPTYSFRRAVPEDLILLGRWLKERHVAKWWREPDEQLAEIQAHIAGDDVESLLVSVEGAPFAYLQWWPAECDPDVPEQPERTRGIDFFIGRTDMLGKGHGPGMIMAFADEAQAAGVPRLVSDPDGRNVSSVGCLGRAGFEPHGLIGPAGDRRLLMARDLIPELCRPVAVSRPTLRKKETT